MAGYINQLNRVQRFLKRLEHQARSSVDYDDDMWSFFQNCWHLKDWIKNDTALPVSFRESIEGIVSALPDLQVCADLANATKHLQLKSPRVGAKHSHRSIEIFGGDSSRTKLDYFIDIGNGTTRNGLDLARQCVVEWERILTAQGLPIK